MRTERWSYARVAENAYKFARELETRRIGRGERVLLCGENSPAWVAAFFGCLSRGVIVVPLDRESATEFLARVQQQTTARLLLCDDDVRDKFALDLPSLPLEELERAVAHHSSEPYPIEDISGETVVEIIYTSGTTSEPKGVRLTHRNLLANLLPLEDEIRKYLKWERPFHPIRFLNLVPLSHVFGQFMGMFVPQLLGGEVHFQESLNPAEIVRTTRRERISVVTLVPRVLDGLREWVERDYAARGRADELRAAIAAAEGSGVLRRWWAFRSMHRRFGWKFWAFVSGGASLDERTETFWRRLGFAVLQGYGMTETASLITVNHPFKPARNSIGKPMPGYEIKLDEGGEIIVRGESVSPGYWSATPQAERSADGWLRTGDIAEQDEHGNLYFKGRKKDVIVTAAGMNIYPEDLEAALNLQPEVRASCVVERQGERGAEPLAVLILRDPEASAEGVIARANEQLAEHQRIRRWFVWTAADFPRTATGKTLKREVAAMIKDEGGRMKDESRETEAARCAVSSHTLSSSAFVLSEAARIAGSTSVQLSSAASLADLRLDSLGRVELLSALEDRFQIEIDEAAFTSATTLGDVEKIVRGGRMGRAAPYPYSRWARSRPAHWLRTLLFYLLVLPITRAMRWMSVMGRERLDALTGPVLFVANHVTLADHALILTALPARFRQRLAIAMEGERLREWRHPLAGTKPFTRLRLLAQYVLVTTFSTSFPFRERAASGAASLTREREQIGVRACSSSPKASAHRTGRCR